MVVINHQPIRRYVCLSQLRLRETSNHGRHNIESYFKNTACKMSEKAVATAQTSQPAPENFSKLLREKDKIIKIQARRIDQLHREITKLRLERDSLNSRVAVLTFKLAHQNKTTNR